MGEMAKKIVKTDIEHLLKILNEAYAEEWLAYYQYWKFLRNISEETIKMGYVRSTAVLPTAEANEFYYWLKEMRNTKGKENLPWNICTLRKMFYESKEMS